MRPSVILLIAVSALPTLAGLVAALVLGSDAAAFSRVLATPGIWLSIASAVWSGILATVLALIVAHFAVALAATAGWLRRLTNFVLPLLAMPHLALGIGLVLVLAPSGLLMRLISPWATGFELPPDWQIVRHPAALSLVLGLVLKESAFLVLALMAALGQVTAGRLLAQSRTLGYAPLKAWFVGVAPLLQRQIRLPLAAVLVFGITNVEVAIPLGPGLPPTFPVMLWRWFIDPSPLIQAQAWAGTLVLMTVTLLVLAVMTLLGRLAARLARRAATSGKRRRGEIPVRRGATVVLATLWTLGALTIGAILLRSAAGPWRFPEVWPAVNVFSTWQAVLPVAGSVTGTTLVIAILTALAGLVLVLPAAEHCRDAPGTRRLVGAMLFLPLLVPQLTFLFGIQVLLVRLDVDGTLAAVVWSHLLFALPYLWGLLAPARAAIDPRYEQVARTLGASKAKTWLRVTAPLLMRALLLAAAVAFSVSIALYLPTLFAGAGRVATSATEAAAAAASGSLRLAAVHAILLALAPLAAFAAAYGAGGWLFRHRAGVS